MNKLLIFLVLFTLGCKKENAETNGCIGLSQNEDFNTIPFTDLYTIQFPSNYKGEGLKIDKSVNFLKFSDSVKIKYSFFCHTNCIKYYGAPLPKPIPNSVIGSTIDSTTLFDQKLEFCMNDILEAIFYHNSDDLSFGILYLKIEDQFLQSATIQFQKKKLDEVIAILKTLKNN